MRMREYAKLRSFFRRAGRECLIHFTPGKDFLQHKRYWFPAKRRGWGWGAPICWEGKVIVLIYVITQIQGARFLESAPHQTLLLVGISTTWLVAICFWKGEKPRWRWDEGN